MLFVCFYKTITIAYVPTKLFLLLCVIFFIRLLTQRVAQVQRQLYKEMQELTNNKKYITNWFLQD